MKFRLNPGTKCSASDQPIYNETVYSCPVCGISPVHVEHTWYGDFYREHLIPIPPVPPKITDVPKHMPGSPAERLRYGRKKAAIALQWFYKAPEEDYHGVVDEAYEIWKSCVRIHNLPFPSWIDRLAETGELYDGELNVE